jgi:hypothetical protein
MDDPLDRIDLTQAQRATNIRVEIVFHVAPSFFYGDDDDLRVDDADAAMAAKSAPLLQPELPRVGRWVTASDALKNTEALGAHYRDVRRLMTQYRKGLMESSHYFWCRPFCFVEPAGSISFPWYDTWPEITALFKALRAPDQGEIFFDRDQCWMLIVFRDQDWIYFRQSDPDEEPEVVHDFVAVPRASLLEQLQRAEQDAAELLQYLVKHTGVNPWKFGRARGDKGSKLDPAPGKAG